MGLAANRVLIISNPSDEHTTSVVSHLETLGVTPTLLYPERFGDSLSLSLHLDDGHSPWACYINYPDEILEFASVASVWYRRPRLPLAKTALSNRSIEFARDEWQSALAALYALSPHALWISRPDNLHLAANKPRQLQLAREVGLSIPRTLISSDPSRILAFYHTCKGRLIAKPTGTGWLDSENDDGGFFVLTNRIQLQDLLDRPSLALAPVTFQEEVIKAYELRVTVVGETVHAVRIDSQMSPISEVDWRRYDTANTPYSAYDLPEAVAARCRQVTRDLGLEYGAIDLIRSLDGQYVFLEINGNGQFLWAELLSGVPISRSLANLLARSTPALTNPMETPYGSIPAHR